LFGLQRKGYQYLDRVGKDGNPISIDGVICGILAWLYPSTKKLNQKFSNGKQKIRFRNTMPKVYQDYLADLKIRREEERRMKREEKRETKLKKFNKRELSCASTELLILAQHRGLRSI